MAQSRFDNLLHKLRRYGPPSPDECEALAAAFAPPRVVAAGQEVIRQFSTPQESTLLVSGLMGRRVTLRDGAQQTTALQVAGDFVDLHGFLLSRMDHSVVALSPCEVAAIPHVHLRRLTDTYPRLARALWRLTLIDAAIHRQWLTVIGRRDAQAATAHLVCELNLRLEDVGLAHGGRFRLPLTQAQVGEVLGLSVVHVNRVIQALRARGLMTWERDRVVILQGEALQMLAEFDPTYLQLTDLPEI